MSDHQMKELLQKSSRKPQPADPATPTTGEHEPDLVRLQRMVGNQAVQRMMSSGTVEISHRTAPTVQAKLTVGAADDAYEREADQVASQVMKKSASIQREGEEEELQMKRADIQREAEGGELEEEELQMKRADIQREAEGGELEEEELQMKRADIQREAEGGELEEEELQMKRGDIQREEEQVDMSGSFDVNGDVESRINAESGSGEAIPDVNRDLFESSMGRDFSGVKIHTGQESDNLNQELGARAFTKGNDIFFREGEYNPGSSSGQELLAHELTHVVQQGGAPLKQKRDEERG